MRFSHTVVLVCKVFVFIAALLGPVTVAMAQTQALPPDVGLVTKLSGQITYVNKLYQETPAEAQAFMKIRRGDRFQLQAGALTQLVYFLGGRQETWKGPATFTVGDSQSNPQTQAQPTVRILPAGTIQGVRRIPVLLRRTGLSRPGAGLIRGGVDKPPTAIALTQEEKAQIAAAKETYRSLRNQTHPGDITPELYLLGILTDYEQYSEMGEVIEEALRRQPDNDILKELREWVHTQSSQGTSPSTK